MSKPSNKNATLTREELDEQVAAFLKKGGKIDKIPPGVSGVQATNGPKHIRISANNATSNAK